MLRGVAGPTPGPLVTAPQETPILFRPGMGIAPCEVLEPVGDVV
jgi:hypothetical protein